LTQPIATDPSAVEIIEFERDLAGTPFERSLLTHEVFERFEVAEYLALIEEANRVGDKEARASFLTSLEEEKEMGEWLKEYAESSIRSEGEIIIAA
jgi:ferritin-like metal-binding protein YciE